MIVTPSAPRRRTAAPARCLAAAAAAARSPCATSCTSLACARRITSTWPRVAGTVSLIVIAGGIRRGFGANHNLVCARAKGRLVFILNDDTVLDRGCIECLRSFMDRNGAVAAAGPRLRHADGRHQPSAFHFPTPGRVAL